MTDSKPSKSEKKRRTLELQTLGEQLIEMDPERLQAIDTDPALIDAVLAARGMRAHGALRRQKQLIGKIMRGVDPAPIRQALAESRRQGQDEKRLFGVTEQWRDRLCEEGSPALQAFREATGDDAAAVAEALILFEHADNSTRRRNASKRLFRDIRAVLIAGMHGGSS